jgi:hypothetical protein
MWQKTPPLEGKHKTQRVLHRPLEITGFSGTGSPIRVDRLTHAYEN